MSIYDKASLVLIPSGTKTSKVYSQKPTNGDGDFTFSRSTAATRVNASGNIEKETQNLLLQSNDFDTSANWVNTSSSETSGHTGYDGSSDAWLLTKSGAGGRLHQNITASGVLTYSVYMKAGASTWGLIQMNGSGADKYVYVNLSTGAKGAVGGGNITEKIEDVGNGWYRISVTASTDATRVRIYPAEENTAGGTSGSVYFQDAQLEQGLVARDYIETTTTAVEGGITDNVPRLDYTDASCPALLLEPQRTNGMHYSEYFDSYYDTDAGFDNITITHNATTSPEGLQNAAKLAGRYTYRDPQTAYIGRNSVVSSQPYVSSVFAKAGGYDYAILTIGTYASGFWASFNLDTGAVNSQPTAANTTASIEDYGDGWYRCMIHTTNTAGTEGIYFTPSVDGTLGTNYTNTTDGVYFWGVQVEAGSYATSYIPTYGSAVTRNAETNSVTSISGLINDSEGTLFVEAATLENGADCRITISDNTITNRVSIEWDANADTIKGFIGVGGNLQTTSYDQTIMNKIALVYNATDARLFINGTKVSTDLSVPSLSGMDRLEFSNYGAALPFVGNTNKLLILQEKLTDQEAIDLTTL